MDAVIGMAICFGLLAMSFIPVKVGFKLIKSVPIMFPLGGFIAGEGMVGLIISAAYIICRTLNLAFFIGL